MADVIKYRFRLRRGTAADWTLKNEVLLASEIGHETDTNKMKVGDGVTPWSGLDYFGGLSYQQGDGISIDFTDPNNPIISCSLAAVALSGRVATYADLPTGLGSSGAGKAYLVDDDGLIYVWSGTTYQQDGSGYAGGGSTKTMLRNLLHFDGVNSGTVFTDEVLGAWSRAGSAVTSTADKKFGTASLFLPGTSARIYYPSAKCFDFQDSDFTVEGWVKPDAGIASNSFGGWVISSDDTSSTTKRGVTIHIGTDGTLRANFYSGGTNYPSASAAGAVSWAAWHHVALCRKGRLLWLYLDGVKVSEVSLPTPFHTADNGATELCIGSNPGGQTGTYFKGYIDEVRVLKGRAAYTGNFTPPTAPFSA